MVGQQILDLLIGVRIPGGQPVKGTGLVLTETHSPRRIGRSVGALLAGFVAVVVLSLATVYRTLDGVVGSYVMARLAPDRPMGHALVGGLIGVAMSTLGAVVTWNKDLGPRWYPLALIVTAMGRQTPRHAVALQPTSVEYHCLVSVG